jgi:hypothetical protein
MDFDENDINVFLNEIDSYLKSIWLKPYHISIDTTSIEHFSKCLGLPRYEGFQLLEEAFNDYHNKNKVIDVMKLNQKSVQILNHLYGIQI